MKTTLHTLRSSFQHTGFSLVETLMATGIVSTTALGTLALLASSMSLGLDGQSRTRALVIAQEIFHDLQTGSTKLTPAEKDERQTKGIWPLPVGTLTLPRHLLLYDEAARLLPAVDQPQVAAAGEVYQDGVGHTKAAWLAVIEGIERVEYSVDPASTSPSASGNYAGDAQVGKGVDLKSYAPLGTTKYDFPVVSDAPDAALPLPKSGLVQVTLSLESPPEMPQASRRKYRYTFYWNR